MSKKRRKANKIRSEPQPSGSSDPTVGFFMSDVAREVLVPGYTRLSDNPEVKTACTPVSS